jgi:hypothetical protein
MLRSLCSFVVPDRAGSVASTLVRSINVLIVAELGGKVNILSAQLARYVEYNAHLLSAIDV